VALMAQQLIFTKLRDLVILAEFVDNVFHQI
jgi:hypothetical protein